MDVLTKQLNRIKEKIKADSVYLNVLERNSGIWRSYPQGDVVKDPCLKFDYCSIPYRVPHRCNHTGEMYCVKLDLRDRNFAAHLLVDKKGDMTNEEKDYLVSSAESIQLILDQLLLKELYHKHRSLLATFSNLIKEATRKRDLKELAQKMTEEACKFFEANTSVFCKVENGRLKIIAHTGPKPVKEHIEPGEGASGTAALTKEPVIFEEYPKEILPEACAPKRDIIASAIAIPIMVEGNLFGTLSFCRTVNQPKFTPVDLNMLKEFGNLINTIISLHLYQKEKEIFDRMVLRTQKLEALGVLASGIAHDFNNTLNVIAGFVQICMEKVRDRPDILEYLNIVLDECQKASKLVSQILLFSREKTKQKDVIDVKPMLKEFTKLISRTLPENIRVKLEIENPEEVYTVMASPEKLHAAFINIVTNAKDAMPKGGDLKIRLAKKRFEHKTPYPKRSVVISFSDTGIGIPEEHINRIFDPFFTTKGTEGTGLGLYQTFNIINSIGGSIDVESEVGRGTTFYIYLPEAEKDIPEKTGYQETSRHIYPEVDIKGKAIVVEDNPALLQVLIHMLKELEVNSEGFEDPEEALERIKRDKDKYTILITDIVMPKTDGFTLADRAREIKPDLKVLYITGYTDQFSKLLSRSSERNTAALFKPFTIFDLGQALKNLFS